MPTKITILSDGPVLVEGDFELKDRSGQAFGLAGRTSIALCRCGHSAGKPFCDGSHRRVGFADPGAARDLPPIKPAV